MGFQGAVGGNPPLGCHRQRDISKLFLKLRFSREQAERLQVFRRALFVDWGNELVTKELVTKEKARYKIAPTLLLRVVFTLM
ncbi:hypothetical protein JFJ09_13890 [Pseudoalteromonas arctica]|uniref:hypothetical protein n=1 Tax=Pseudoalteromonas arctica TaxID=394751 RepID=UPI001C9CE7F8|nr:hypothetical protein [Pseudoalteromonas arctica]MBZ2193299.1 hypothetical protein [Pseudoalteromonas arctica]